MPGPKLNDSLQLAGSLSILIGLVFVAYEIRQNNILAEAEAVEAMQTGWELVSVSEYETDISKLRVKSLIEPENLTDSEVYELSSWLYVITLQLDRRIEFAERGLTYGGSEIGIEPASEIASTFDFYFNNRFGRAWYADSRSWLDPKITEVFDQKLQDDLPVNDGNYGPYLRELIQQQSTDH
jgi:hypothetical protein